MNWVSDRRKLLNLLFAALSLGASAHADCELDFSPRHPGAVYDRTGRFVGCVRTETVYGRRLGDAMDVNPRFVYPAYAVGRGGEVNALQFGNALREVPDARPAGLKADVTVPTGVPVTQLLWFYVYDQPARDCQVSLLYSKFGWQHGFRCVWERAGWSPEGHVSACLGIGAAGTATVTTFGKRLDGTYKRTARAGAWHQLAIVLDGRTAALYLDGERADEKPCGFYRDDARGTGLKLSFAETGDRAWFKTDFYGLYTRAWTDAEVAADWRRGRPAADCDERAVLAHWNSISIPATSAGYFKVGEKIPLSVDGRVKKTYRFDRPGLHEIVCEGKRFPVGIVPALPSATCRVGVFDLMNRQPEAVALGVRGTVVEVRPERIEPRKNEFDWTELDRFTDVCAEKGVRVYLVPHAACSPKLRAYLGARYDNARVVADVNTFTILPSDVPDFRAGEAADKVAARKLVTDLLDARLAGKKNLVLRNGPTVWSVGPDDAYSGRPSWRGIALAWYVARCGGASVTTPAERDALLSELDDMISKPHNKNSGDR